MINQSCSVKSFREVELIKQTWMGNCLRAQEAIFTHIRFSLCFYGSLSPQAPLKDTTALKHTVRIYVFPDERNLLLLKLTAIHLAWLKMGRHLYNKNCTADIMCSWGRCLICFLQPVLQGDSLILLKYRINILSHLLVFPKTAHIPPWEGCSQLSCISWTVDVWIKKVMFSSAERPKDQSEGSCGEGLVMKELERNTAERASGYSLIGPRSSRAAAAAAAQRVSYTGCR